MLINRRFGDYVLLKKIATGGMAEIFLARRPEVSLPKGLVVLKSIIAGRTENESYQRMFRNEAELAAHFDHPHVVRLHEVVEHEGTECMVLEFLHGKTLAELLAAASENNQSLPLEAALWLIMKACEGLDHIHNLTGEEGQSLDIVHRDLSPQNILVTFDGQVKIFDFGIATSSLHDADWLEGAMAGTVAYMSPEQCRGESIDARSDVFSLGTVLWELTTGQRLFARDNQIKSINALIEEPIPSPIEVDPEYPPKLAEAVMGALERDRDKRTRNCLVLRMALNRFLNENNLKPHRHQISDLMNSLFADDLTVFDFILDAAREAGDAAPLRRGRPAPPEEPQGPDAPLARAAAEALSTPSHRAVASGDASAAIESLDFPAPITSPGVPMQVPNTPSMAYPTQPPPGGIPKAFVAVAAVGLVLALAVVGGLAYMMVTGEANVQQPPPKTASRPTSGSLYIDTTPEGAQITLGGRQLSVRTPTNLPGLPFEKAVVVTLEKPGFVPVQRKLTLTVDDHKQMLKVEMDKEDTTNTGMGGLRVLTTPPDARIFLDNRKIADSTPVTFLKVSADNEHALRISRDGYGDEIIPFKVTRGEIRDFEVELSESTDNPLAQLTIGSEPSGCRVTINGDFYGTTPIPNLYMPASIPLDTTVACRNFGSWQRRIVLAPDEDRTVRAALGLAAAEAPENTEDEAPESPLAKADAPPDNMATLSLTTDPPTIVSANGQAIGESPLAGLKLKPGRYVLTFRNKAQNITYAQRVKLEANKSESLKIAIPQGTLNVSSDLDAEVYINGQKVGDAPVKRHKLYAGIHRVRVVSTEMGYAREYRLRFRGDDKKAITTRFKEVRITRVSEPKPEETPKEDPEADKGEEETPPEEPAPEETTPEEAVDKGDDKGEDQPKQDDKTPAPKAVDKGAGKKGPATNKKPVKPKKPNPLDDEPYPLLR